MILKEHGVYEVATEELDMNLYVTNKRKIRKLENLREETTAYGMWTVLETIQGCARTVLENVPADKLTLEMVKSRLRSDEDKRNAEVKPSNAFSLLKEPIKIAVAKNDKFIFATTVGDIHVINYVTNRRINCTLYI
ncbi:hypothetical protein FQR65_LT18380 [Abscondita terminalis]|nr:hypothetical protein FQR65_LT13555 [Abscondita terminalis]KAF5307593.1 hypothetical protein FQR65_LT18380 [Abscondita terminalis]